MRRAIAASVMIILLVPVVTSAQTERSSLRAAGPIAVEVEVIGSADVQKAGVTNDALKAAIEQRLRQRQVPVDSGAKSRLAVSINTIRSSVGVYATCITVEVRQEVWILQNRLTVLAATWQRDSVGVRGPDRLLGIGDVVMEYVGNFIEDYIAENP